MMHKGVRYALLTVHSQGQLIHRWVRWIGWSWALILCVVGCDSAATGPAAPDLETRSGASAASMSSRAVASSKGRVDVEGGLIRLSAGHDGVVTQVLVEEGQHVQAGQVLARLEDALLVRQKTVIQREREQAQQELKRALLGLQVSKREVQRLKSFTVDDTIAAQDLDKATDDQKMAQLAVHSARAAIATATARELIAKREIEERQVLAPQDGQIIARHVHPGQGVSTLNVTPMFLFAPHKPKIIRAELEEQYVSQVHTEQDAEIVLEADPTKTWSTKVIRLGSMVGAKSSSDDPTERQDNRVVETVLSLPEAAGLLIGQRVIVRFLP